MAACLIAAAVYVVAPGFITSNGYLFAQADASKDAEIQANVRRQLKDKQFSGVTVNVNGSNVTLSGEVDLFAYKADAMKKAKKVKGVKEVTDNIAVGGPNVPDQVLQQKLLGKIQMDRIGFGQVFSAISVQVQNGAVLLGGHALDPITQQSAVGLASYMPGVKSVENKIQVDPVSPLDNRVRRAEYNAIYNYGPLRQYAMVPSKPIRISVQNGNVTLYGVVDKQMDKDMAGLRANQVPGVFHVTNNLIVAGQESDKK
jgi:osmotically-inducible protein OsmY